MHNLKKLKLTPFRLSVLINIIFLTFILLVFDIKYEVSDDYIVDSVLSGAYTPKGSGYYDVHLLFSNILLGYPLKLLYVALPTVSWYFIFLMTVSFLSLSTVTYLIISFLNTDNNGLRSQRQRYTGAISISTIFLIYYALDLYVIPQFTKIAAAASISGGSLFLYLIWTKRKKKKLLLSFSVVLTILGTFIRFSVLAIALPFLLLQFAFYFSDYFNAKYGNSSIKPLIKATLFRFALCLILIGSIILLNFIGTSIWNSRDVYKNYRTYNSLRSSITDVSKQGYSSVSETFEIIGYDDVDYYMLNSWNFYDKNIYSEDRLEFVSTTLKNISDEKNHSLETVVDQLIKRDYSSYHIFIGLMILIITMIIINPKSIIWHIGTFILLIFLLGIFFWIGRVVYRVEYSVFWGSAVTAIICGGYKIHSCHRRAAYPLLSAAVMIFLFNILHFIPDSAYKTMEDYEYRSYVSNTLSPSWDYIPDKYRINVNSLRPYGRLIEYMENDTECYYLLDFSSCIQLIYYDYKPWMRMDQSYFDENYMYLGGVTMEYPAERDLFERHGINPDCPYKDIVKEGIYVIDNKYSDTKLQYLRKYYYPNARKELIDTIDGFKIWKFYAE